MESFPFSFQVSCLNISAIKMRISTLIAAICAAALPLIHDATALFLSRQLFHRCRDTRGDQGFVACCETYHSNASGVDMNYCRSEQCLDLSSLQQILGYCDSLRCDETREVINGKDEISTCKNVEMVARLSLNFTEECHMFSRKPGIVCLGVGELI